MEEKLIYKKTLKIAVPMMIQNGITNAVGLVDNVMVGNLGTNAVTAVSIIGQLFFVFSLAIFGGLSGPGIYAAQYYGQKNIEGFRQTFRIKHWICGFCLVAGLCAFIFAAEPLIGLYMRGEGGEVDPAETMRLAKEYLGVMLIGMAPFVITQIYASSLRETGDTFMPMMAGVASVVVDVVFNYLLIFGNFGFPQLGVKGAAIATVIARFVEMTIVLTVAFAKRKKYVFLQGAYKTLLVPRAVSAKIIKKGLPIFFNEFLWSAGIAAITQTYSTLGLDIVAGLNISNTLCNLLNVVFVAMGNAVGIVIGQMLGASEYEKAQKSSLRLAAFTGVICVALTAILVGVSGVFPNLYNTTDDIKHLGQWFIVITALYFPVQGFLNALYFTLRSGGKTLITFLFDSVFSWVVTIPLTLLLCSFSGLPVIGIYAIVQAADIIKVIIGFILVKRGLWISNIVE
ncbi:MAG: MATE family efflux transporter [[Eubacterium] saphenum]|nr:MATE family efflux transporter [[Eubacterium] saphenum]